RDWDRFAASGPGSCRGLNRVYGREFNSPWREDDWRLKLTQLRARSDPHFKSHNLPPISAHDAQNALCEWDKYERERLGQGPPRQKFQPHDDCRKPPARKPQRLAVGASPQLDE